ncbi:aspartate ammonia-lyase [Pseudoduganella sp. LjRoot289]|uniref:aspartate ammonia-lyase n=1 Tax=Pseudoduganella sp. LjRoot289 TaxID=3342314 RepID=UPI003ECCFDDE
MPSTEHRTEHDLLGERAIPQHAYYGIHTLRAVENFPISGTPIGRHPDLIVALATVKQAAAVANRQLGLLDGDLAAAIVAACQEIRDGRLHGEFVVDMIQGGAGTSTNMNANEVIANRALELLGQPRGAYHALHPNEHVNLGQSTNDVYPTALRLAAHAGAQRLLAAMEQLRCSFSAKADEFAGVMKMGRTQLQDAVPMTLGQEFRSYAVMLADDQARLAEAAALLGEINLGATAIGTGINCHPEYASLVRRALSGLSGVTLTTAPDLIAATQDVGAFVQLSGVLKRAALKLSKICNDLRLLSSGPRAGLGEIRLPPMQAGSSIMPGKVNPVIPEVVNQIAFEVLGNDVTISFAAEGGQLQLNAFEPIIAYALFNSIAHLDAGCRVLASRCVDGISANAGHLQAQVDNSIGLATALNPFIGYEAATRLAQDALASGRGVRQLVLELDLLSPSELERVLQPASLTRPRPVAAA